MVIKFQLKNCKIKFCKEGKDLYSYLTISDHFHFKITLTSVNRENLEKSTFLRSLSKEVFSQVQTMSLFPFSVDHSTVSLSSACNLDDGYKPGQYRDSFFHLPLA